MSAPRTKLRRTITVAAALVLFVLISLLAAILMEYYQKSLLRTREGLLHQNLFVMREAIDQYRMDMNAAPQSLDDLRQANYLPAIPEDPFTHSTAWSIDICQTPVSPGQPATGICDIHSRAPGSSPFEGTPYRDW
jgi:general secretion pathway protein G